ncbi:DUF221-domain-containing protein [Polychaeton citri CBS 116435]|uniref:DUF221-domain-containing protein n=1 Tax=Polychaeton citri CBS 116435 TaxID=1314669 RepID=A0A9P4UIW2_9PEZI|nr:DUF221-domain-containing protein [Polychaeton citri CBS 116435]
MSTIPSSDGSANCTGNAVEQLFGCGGQALDSANETIGSLVAAIVAALGSFGAQVGIFFILRWRLSRIYRPRTYLVAERERTPIPPSGLVGWILPVFQTPNFAFIQKCGLDAFFFLRFLRMLLKIFLPAACVILPILLPINKNSGEGQIQGATATGLDKLSISNIGRARTSRTWAHLILAVLFIFWILWVIFEELRNYIRVRQAYLTSPQHRLRASATSVLVTEIPKKWLTHQALEGLYDVFPGGLKNIWINRNFDELADKVSERDKIAKSLESAESDLIKKCRTADLKRQEKERKTTRAEKKEAQAADTREAESRAGGDEGIHTAGMEHQSSGLTDMLREAEEEERRRESIDHVTHKHKDPKYVLENGFNTLKHGFDTAGKGVGQFGKGFGQFAAKTIGGVERDAHRGVERMNDGPGFMTEEEWKRLNTAEGGEDSRTTQTKSSVIHQEEHQNVQDATAGAQVVASDGHDSPRVHPLDVPISAPANDHIQSPSSAYSWKTNPTTPAIGVIRPSAESEPRPPRSPMQIEEPEGLKPHKQWQFWKNSDQSIVLPSPQPHYSDEDEFPLQVKSVPGAGNPVPGERESGSKWYEKLAFWKTVPEEEKTKYPDAYDADRDADQDEEAKWREYIEPKDRDTTRMPLLDYDWFPSLPLVGKKVDTIYHLRRELARLNQEIEIDQKNPEKFPTMGSAFIQFHHQVAAHMAVQSLSHHVPQHMAPRLLEISPNDVIWDNMSIRWWERYLRSTIVLLIAIGLIVLFAVPVTFTSLLANVDTLSHKYSWLAWMRDLPSAVISIIQGVLPPALLAALLALVPIIFRVLVKQQGVPTGNLREMGVQRWYFAFLWIQVFLVVSISGGLVNIVNTISKAPNNTLTVIAQDLPKAANYFFSYLTIQALSNSASALVQVGTLFVWFIWAPINDSTARQKYTRQTKLNQIKWGSFFPPFANFAVIAIIYSIIAPLIMVFVIVIFCLFWFVYRYNVLYVYQFRNDTGGLLFPVAVNQLFTGVYTMEVALAAYFFITTNTKGKLSCLPQAIIMCVMIAFTIAYQVSLNKAFAPLFQYLPITLEDEAVLRDEKFAREQASRFAPLTADRDDNAIEDDDEDNRSTPEKSGYGINQQRSASSSSSPAPEHRAGAWARRKSSVARGPRWRHAAPEAISRLQHLAIGGTPASGSEKKSARHAHIDVTKHHSDDPEAQHTVADVLFSGFADELEDLTPEERDLLVRYAFQHSALRARRPTVWIPNDKLKVSDDEIKRAAKMSTVTVDGVERTNISMSNEGTALDGKNRVVFRKSPPDFQSVDLILL